MAQEYVDPIGGSLIIPAAYSSITVAPNNSGLATTGVLVLMGEADSGPAFSEEEELDDNSFGPDQLQDVIAKYKSGRIVDAFRAASTAVVDPDLGGAFSRAIIVKTNTGVKASSALTSQNGATAYVSLRAKLAGSLGNLINYTITNPTVGTTPTTSAFTYIPQPGQVDLAFNSSGRVVETLAVVADRTPTLFVSDVDALLRVAASGGAKRTAFAAGTPDIALAIVAGNAITLTLTAVNWDASVAAGDTLYIPAGSEVVGAGGQNEGWYVVTAVAANVLSATKLSDRSSTAGHAPGAVVAPLAVGAVASNVNHDLTLIVYSPVTISEQGTAIVGAGRSLEVSGTSAQAGDTNPTNMFYVLGTNTKVSWLSLTTAPKLITSTAELSVSINLRRSFDSLSEDIVAGGEVALKLGFDGYSATVAISSTTVTLTTKATGGGDPDVVTTLTLTDYPTIADLATKINTISGWSAAVGTAVLGNLSSAYLDKTVWGSFATSYNAASQFGAQACRIKIDAYRLRSALANGSTGAEFATTPYGGLPNEVPNTAYFTGGSKGGTLVASITSAIDALERVKCNFVVPLFSRDATSDYADAQTEATSTYTIDGINAAVKSHVHKMSTMKAKKNRQAFVSKRDSFSVVSESAANLASHRTAMVFQDVKSAISGAIVQYQPWLAAAMAAATQAAAFYKSLVRKQVNITAAVQAAADWSYNSDSQLENALKAGLNPIRKADEGGFVWVSDQTTYGKDANQVYNSIQMVYAADVVALTTAQRMERAFVGKSVADVSAAVALSYLDGIMADFLRLKLIAASSDAPLGYKNARIVIEGPAMRVSVEVKIAGSIYFIPISFYVTEITQSA